MTTPAITHFEFNVTAPTRKGKIGKKLLVKVFLHYINGITEKSGNCTECGSDVHGTSGDKYGWSFESLEVTEIVDQNTQCVIHPLSGVGRRIMSRIKRLEEILLCEDCFHRLIAEPGHIEEQFLNKMDEK